MKKRTKEEMREYQRVRRQRIKDGVTTGNNVTPQLQPANSRNVTPLTSTSEATPDLTPASESSQAKNVTPNRTPTGGYKGIAQVLAEMANGRVNNGK